MLVWNGWSDVTGQFAVQRRQAVRLDLDNPSAYVYIQHCVFTTYRIYINRFVQRVSHWTAD